MSVYETMSRQSILYPFELAILQVHETLTQFIHTFNPVNVLREFEDEEVNETTMQETVNTSDDDDIEACEGTREVVDPEDINMNICTN